MSSTTTHQIHQYFDVNWIYQTSRFSPYDTYHEANNGSVIYYAIREYAKFVNPEGGKSCFVFRNNPVALAKIGAGWSIIQDKSFLALDEFTSIHDFPTPEDAIMFMALEGGKYDETWKINQMNV